MVVASARATEPREPQRQRGIDSAASGTCSHHFRSTDGGFSQPARECGRDSVGTGSFRLRRLLAARLQIRPPKGALRIGRTCDVHTLREVCGGTGRCASNAFWLAAMGTSVGFVGRQAELRVLEERLAAAQLGRPQVVFVEAEAGAGKSTLLSQFLGSLANAVVLEVGGDEAETLLSYGVIDQLQPGTLTDPGTDPMAVGARLVDLLDQLQSDSQVVVLAIDDLQWADRPSSRAVLFALRRLRADKVLTVVSARVGELTDPGWARFMGGDARVTRIRLAGLSPEDLTSWRARSDWGRCLGRGASRLVAAHGRKCSLLSGVARRDRRCRTERGARWPAGAAGALRGDPGPRGCARQLQRRLPGGSLGAGQHAPASTIASVARLADASSEVDAAVAAGLYERTAVSRRS